LYPEEMIKRLIRQLEESLKDIEGWMQHLDRNEVMTKAVCLLTTPPEYVAKLSPETRSAYANTVSAIRARFWTDELG